MELTDEQLQSLSSLLPGIDTPIYLTARDIMTKTSVFARINTTRSDIFTIGKVLEKNGFKLTKSNEKRLCEVFGTSLEQVKAHFSRPEQDKEELDKKGKDIANGQGINSDLRLPLQVHSGRLGRSFMCFEKHFLEYKKGCRTY